MKKKKLLKLLKLIEVYEKVMIARGVQGYGVGHPYPEQNEKPRLGDTPEEDSEEENNEKVKISKAFRS